MVSVPFAIIVGTPHPASRASSRLCGRPADASRCVPTGNTGRVEHLAPAAIIVGIRDLHPFAYTVHPACYPAVPVDRPTHRVTWLHLHCRRIAIAASVLGTHRDASAARRLAHWFMEWGLCRSHDVLRDEDPLVRRLARCRSGGSDASRCVPTGNAGRVDHLAPAAVIVGIRNPHPLAYTLHPARWRDIAPFVLTCGRIAMRPYREHRPCQPSSTGRDNRRDLRPARIRLHSASCVPSRRSC